MKKDFLFERICIEKIILVWIICVEVYIKYYMDRKGCVNC